MPAIETPPEPAAPAVAPKPSVAEQAAKVTINVSSLPKDPVPSKPPKAGSAKAKMFDDMQKKFGGESVPSAAKPTVPSRAEKASVASPAAEAETPGTTEGGESTPPPSTEATQTQPEATVTPSPAPAEGEKGKKVSPWKLVDQFKERASSAEAKIIELEKQVGSEEQRKAASTKLQELESQVKTMSEDLRYYEAEKYDPDVKKAKEDYNRAFNRAMKELKSVVIIDPTTQQPRAITVNDLAELAFMDLGQATQVAKDAFGDLAPYVMDHRNEIRRLWDTQEEVKETLKKTGSVREQQRMEAAQKYTKALSDFVTQTYEKANAEAAADPKHGHYFKPREGDADWNTRLEKGFKLVDEAFTANAHDPKLTSEQRAEVIRKHAAVRNRAAAFGPLRHKVEKLEEQLKEALSELEEFKSTTPTPGGRVAVPVVEKKKGMAGLRDELQKIAH
jgi:hypothetical protein